LPDAEHNERSAPVRTFWSGVITFGLVSIPVDLYSAVQPRAKSMKMVDREGHALGRQYRCSAEDKKLSAEDLVRGYETESGKMVVITDEEFESLAPEMSRDIELRAFVPLEQIPTMYYDRPYFLAPSGGSSKAYNLLAKTLERTNRVGIGTFVMRGHEYLCAILSESGVLRAETLRHRAELRTPEAIGLSKPGKPAAKRVNRLAKVIEELTRDKLDMAEFADRDAQAIQQLAHAKQEKGQDVIDYADSSEESGGAEIVDLMAVLRRSLSKKAQVSTPEGATGDAPPTRPAARRSTTRPARKTSSRRRTPPARAPRHAARRK
jgi:DNA end-binding protein Ku